MAWFVMPMKQMSLRAIWATGVISTVALAAAGAPAEGAWHVEVGQTVEITLSHGRCWFPTIHQFRSGEILVTMQMGPDQVDAEAESSAYCISRDGGATWSRRYPMGDEANADGAWTEAPDNHDCLWRWGNYPEPRRAGEEQSFLTSRASYSAGGRIVCIDRSVVVNVQRPLYPARVALFDYLFPFLSQEPAPVLQKSGSLPKKLITTDYQFQGETPVPDTRITTQYLLKAWGNVITGPQGELLSDGYLSRAEDVIKRHGSAARGWHWSGELRNVLLRSSDGGQTWSEYSTIAENPEGKRPDWMGDEGPNEGSLALLADHRLYAVYRTGGKGMIGNGWSSDGGKTWTPPASIGFQGVAPRLHRLGGGGLAMVTGRPGPVVVRFNSDGKGEHWSPPVILYRGKSTSYADLVEVRPGRLLVVYDSVPYGWYQIPFADRETKNRILGTFVSLEGK